ncbi:FMN-binding protein [Fusobacterium simiae]|uniref:FMN-binding protein n=1 Tax=Fusobacterium simiae TaxID=855 RepID=A0ABT4DH47_FUSSI|nr:MULTISPECIES: FMN-binding protein [Fusobacterium]MCY7007932.1 FMN-binding protein [Fusobacterium simiae]MDC7955934.1 FMN-binding protein [Fusobacterium simiae]
MKNLKSLMVISFAILSLGSFADEKVYEAKAESKGFNEDGVPIVLTVKAIKKDGKVVITDIIAQHQETKEIGAVAITKLIEEVKEKQNYNKMDNIAGATATSAGFRRAIRNAVKDIEKQN